MLNKPAKSNEMSAGELRRLEVWLATMLRVDLGVRSWRGPVMTDDDLIAALCVRIGMIMEDSCGDAVTVRPGDRDGLACAVYRLQQASQRIEVLVRAAAALLDTD